MDSYFDFFQIFEYLVPLLMTLQKKQLLKYSDYISLNHAELCNLSYWNDKSQN